MTRTIKRTTIAAMAIIATLFASMALLGCSTQGESQQADQDSFLNQVSDYQVSSEGLTENTSKSLPLEGVTICIDAGHGAIPDSTQEAIGPGSSKTRPREPGGASGVATGTPEYAIVLNVALKLQQDLTEQGATVVMVRTTNDVDISSRERAAVANDCNARLFIRLHCDGADNSSSHGFSTLIPGSNQWTEANGIIAESSRAGTFLHNAIVDALGVSDRGVVERNDLAGFNWCETPCVLFEMGFLSNAAEEAKLITDDYQSQLAAAICDGCVSYYTSGVAA